MVKRKSIAKRSRLQKQKQKQTQIVNINLAKAKPRRKAKGKTPKVIIKERSLPVYVNYPSFIPSAFNAPPQQSLIRPTPSVASTQSLAPRIASELTTETGNLLLSTPSIVEPLSLIRREVTEPPRPLRIQPPEEVVETPERVNPFQRYPDEEINRLLTRDLGLLPERQREGEDIPTDVEEEAIVEAPVTRKRQPLAPAPAFLPLVPKPVVEEEEFFDLPEEEELLPAIEASVPLAPVPPITDPFNLSPQQQLSFPSEFLETPLQTEQRLQRNETEQFGKEDINVAIPSLVRVVNPYTEQRLERIETEQFGKEDINVAEPILFPEVKESIFDLPVVPLSQFLSSTDITGTPKYLVRPTPITKEERLRLTEQRKAEQIEKQNRLFGAEDIRYPFNTQPLAPLAVEPTKKGFFGVEQLPVPKKRGPGRPLGSVNKPKVVEKESVALQSIFPTEANVEPPSIPFQTAVIEEEGFKYSPPLSELGGFASLLKPKLEPVKEGGLERVRQSEKDESKVRPFFGLSN